MTGKVLEEHLEGVGQRIDVSAELPQRLEPVPPITDLQLLLHPLTLLPPSGIGSAYAIAGYPEDRRATLRDWVEAAVMLGAFIMVLVLVVGLPVTFLVTGTVLSIILGQTLWRDGEDRHRGSELVSLNR